MKMRFSAAALVLAGVLSTPAQAQTAPPNGWNAHIAGCFASDPSFFEPQRGFERLPTPSTAQRVETTFTSSIGARRVRMAVWRQDCANNPAFPVLMVRFEQIRDPQGGFRLPILLQSREVELIQGGTVTQAEAIGTCAAATCFSSAHPYDEEAV